jgi:hypothetical protein
LGRFESEFHSKLLRDFASGCIANETRVERRAALPTHCLNFNFFGGYPYDDYAYDDSYYDNASLLLNDNGLRHGLPLETSPPNAEKRGILGNGFSLTPNLGTSNVLIRRY